MFSAHKMNITLVITHPVAVVNCPVHDENFLYFRELQKLTGGDGHRVEVAEAHGLLSLGVVTRRSHQTEPIGQLVGRDLLDELHDGADGVPGGGRGVELVPVSVGVHAGTSTREDGQLVESPAQLLTHQLPLVDGLRAEHEGVGLCVAALDVVETGEHGDLFTVRQEPSVHQPRQNELKSEKNHIKKNSNLSSRTSLGSPGGSWCCHSDTDVSAWRCGTRSQSSEVSGAPD